MVSLADRLEPILGAKAARGLEEAFGIRTVEDLLRHYPRKYSQGSKVLGAEDAPPEPGEHVTFVGEVDVSHFPSVYGPAGSAANVKKQRKVLRVVWAI